MRFFIPRQLIYYSKDSGLFFYTIRHAWDGSFSIQACEHLKSEQPFILLLDSDIPFRRRFQFTIKQRLQKEFVLASAAGLFPFALDDMLCCLGRKNAESYIFALRQADFDEILTDKGLSGIPQAVLVSDFSDAAIESSVTAWLANRSVYAFDNKRFPLNVRYFVTVAVSVLIIFETLADWFLWDDYFSENKQLKQQQAQQIMAKAKPLLHKQLAISHFYAFFSAMEQLSSLDVDRLLAKMLPVLDKLPKGSFVEEIKYEENRLAVNGWGNISSDWFIQHGINEKDFEVVELPKENRFTFYMRLH